MNRKDHLTCQQIVKFLMIYRNGASQLRTNLEVLQHTKLTPMTLCKSIGVVCIKEMNFYLIFIMSVITFFLNSF
uniref:Uncharacterized protein n=1 Tax=Meloidogyne enterolobii TaxID=390850 RepID=A0A6V7Y7B3_MELEN|nr:unnamed protein product [Meloidogyne enterolobii]